MLKTFVVVQNLHPTMYLLILLASVYHDNKFDLFTSHYVSINSLLQKRYSRQYPHLHPTMYLLILLIHASRHLIG